MAMTNEEAVALATKTNETLVKVSNETDELLREIAELEKALADAIAAGGQITPELEAALKACAVRSHSIDELVTDKPQPEV